MIARAVFTNENEFERWIHDKRHQMLDAIAVTFTSECVFNDNFRDLLVNRFGTIQQKLTSIQIILDAVQLSMEDMQAIARLLMNQNKITKLKLGFRFCALSRECIELAIEGISQLKHLNQFAIDLSGNPQLVNVSNIHLLWSTVGKSIKFKLCNSDLRQLPAMFINSKTEENNEKKTENSNNNSSKNNLTHSQECSNGQQQHQQLTLKKCDLELIVIDLSGNPNLQANNKNISQRTILQELSLGIGGLVNALDRLVIKGLNATATSSTDLFEFLISTPFILDIAISKPNLLHKLIYTNFLKLINTAKRKFKQSMSLQAEKSYLKQQHKQFDSSKDFILPRKAAPKVTSLQKQLYNSQLLDYAQNYLTPIQPINPKNSAATSSLFIQLPMIDVMDGADAEDTHEKQLLLSRSFEFLISQISCILTHGKKLLTTAQFQHANHGNGFNSINGNNSIYQISSGQYNARLERAVRIHCVNELALELAFSGYLPDPRELLQELSMLLLQLSKLLDIMVLRLWVKKGITDFRLASLALLTPLNPQTTFQANAFTCTKSTLMISLLHSEYVSSNDIQVFALDVIHSLPHIAVIAITFDLKSTCCVQRISLLLNNLKQSVDATAQVAYFYLRHQDSVLEVDQQELINLRELVNGADNLIHKRATREMPCPCIYGRYLEEGEEQMENGSEEECYDGCYDDYFIMEVEDEKQGKEEGEGEEEGKRQKQQQKELESSFFRIEDQEEEEEDQKVAKEKLNEKEEKQHKSHKRNSTKKDHSNNNINSSNIEGNEENQNMDNLLQSSKDQSKKKPKTSKKKKSKIDPENQIVSEIENPVISAAETQDVQEPQLPKEKPPRKKYPKKPKPQKTPEEIQKQEELLLQQQTSGVNQIERTGELTQLKALEGENEEQKAGETKAEKDGIGLIQPAEIQKAIRKTKPKKPKEKKIKASDQIASVIVGGDGVVDQTEGEKKLEQSNGEEEEGGGEGMQQDIYQTNIKEKSNQEGQEERAGEQSQSQQQSDKLDQDLAPPPIIQSDSKPKKKRPYVFKSKKLVNKETKKESSPSQPPAPQTQLQQPAPQVNPLLNFAQLMIELGTLQNQGSEFDLKKWIAEELESLQKKEDSQDNSNNQLVSGSSSCDVPTQGNAQQACQQEYKDTIGLIVSQIQQIQTEHKKNLLLSSDQDNKESSKDTNNQMEGRNVEAAQEKTVMDEGQIEGDEGNSKNAMALETTTTTTNNNIGFVNSSTKLSIEQEQDIRNEFALFIQQTQNNRINSSFSGINLNSLLNSDAYGVTVPEITVPEVVIPEITVPEVAEAPPKKKRIKKEGETKLKVPRQSKKQQQQQQDSETAEPRQKRKYTKKQKNIEKDKTKGDKGNEEIVGEEVVQEAQGGDGNRQKNTEKGEDIEGKVEEESQEMEERSKEKDRNEENDKMEDIEDGKEDRDQESDAKELNCDKEEVLRKVSVDTEEGKISDKDNEEDDSKQGKERLQQIEGEGLKQQEQEQGNQNNIKEDQLQQKEEEE